MNSIIASLLPPSNIIIRPSQFGLHNLLLTNGLISINIVLDCVYFRILLSRLYIWILFSILRYLVTDIFWIKLGGRRKKKKSNFSKLGFWKGVGIEKRQVATYPPFSVTIMTKKKKKIVLLDLHHIITLVEWKAIIYQKIKNWNN